MNFQPEELIAASKAAYEQWTIEAGFMPDGATEWENRAPEFKERWMKAVEAALRVLHPRAKKKQGA